MGLGILQLRQSHALFLGYSKKKDMNSEQKCAGSQILVCTGHIIMLNQLPLAT
jgi:hypothetical protein